MQAAGPGHPEDIRDAMQTVQKSFQQQMSAVTDQFGQMGPGAVRKPFALYLTNLVISPSSPREILLPPSEIRLSPNACISVPVHACGSIVWALYDQHNFYDGFVAQQIQVTIQVGYNDMPFAEGG